MDEDAVEDGVRERGEAGGETASAAGPAGVGTPAAAAERPEGDGRAHWRAHWRERGQPWRTEPEIAEERRAFLAQRRRVPASIAQGAYPFGGIALDRADVEWLLATHEDGRGPVAWDDEAQRGREGLDLRGAMLRRANLRGLPLARLRAGVRGATPEQVAAAAAHLEDADLRGALLQGADLRGAGLDGADLRGTRLEEATLAGVSLARTDLREARLRRADLREVRAEGANLEGAELQEARLEKALLDGARLREARLEGANLNNARLQGASLLRARLGGAQLYATRLEGANLHGAHLERAILRNAYLQGADLREAHLEGADLLRARLEHANAEEAHLEGALLLGAHLEDANLYAAHLEGKHAAHLEGKRAAPPPEGAAAPRAGRWHRIRDAGETVPPADLRGAFLDSGTNLRHATLGDDDLGYVSLADVTWGGVNLAVVRWVRRARAVGPGRTRDVILGDEREARRPRTRAGEAKDAERWLAGYEAAVRAYRQLAVALRAQGLDEDAARFAYRAQVLQRQVQRRQGRPGSYLFSLFLDLLAGYGYRPGRSLATYLAVIFGFAAAYLALGQGAGPHLSPLASLVFSITSFHGRGFFPGGIALDDPLTVLAAAEAIIGLVIEISFIATFTQRFFGK